MKLPNNGAVYACMRVRVWEELSLVVGWLEHWNAKAKNNDGSGCESRCV